MASVTPPSLSCFEVPRALVEPAVAALRLGNTALDAIFYDVGALAAALFAHGDYVDAGSSPASMPHGLHEIELGALANPEGSILIVDAAATPYVQPAFDDVKAFTSRANEPAEPPIHTLSVTGIGSSALGSAAFAWNISRALGEPVAAIVPGYGVADVVAQGLGGWFGFGLQSWLIKEATQNVLARTAPDVARIGRNLMMTARGHGETETGAPVFRRGSGSSDVLHAILEETPGIVRLFGHSKGALVIENAIHDLPGATAERLEIVTFGCPIAEDTPATYRQFLGWLDPLGLFNSWGNAPDRLIPARHTTNTWLPLSTPVTPLSRAAGMR